MYFYLFLVFLCIIMHKEINLNIRRVRKFSLNFSSPIFLDFKVTFGAHSKDIFYYCLVNILNSYLSNDTKHLYSVFPYFFKSIENIEFHCNFFFGSFSL